MSLDIEKNMKIQCFKIQCFKKCQQKSLFMLLF